MTKQEAINELTRAAEICPTTPLAEACRMAVDALAEWQDAAITNRLNNLPSAQQWIPCSERLPEIKEHHVSDTVICYCSNGAYAFSQLEENIFGQCGFECERDDDYYEAVGEVVAWMPLPEPWKGDTP